ncbi:MAG: hypothetical protein ACC634_09180, partial [Hyphomicrobiales bacterium]
VRIAGRSTQGVTIFNVADGERVVSVERLSDFENDDDDEDEEEEEDDNGAEGNDSPDTDGGSSESDSGSPDEKE